VCVWGGEEWRDFSNLWIFLRKCCSAHYPGFVLNCCKPDQNLCGNSVSRIRGLTCLSRLTCLLVMSCPCFYFVFSHVRLLLFCLQQQHCLNKSCMFIQDLLAYVILGPWSKWRYCPFCLTSLYVRHAIIGCRKLKGKILDCSLTAYVSYNNSRKAVSCFKNWNEHKHAPRR
jgi:hypothetical protein